MNDFVIFVVGIISLVLGILFGFGGGRDIGREQACKSIQAEWYQTECVIVKRKKVEL